MFVCLFVCFNPVAGIQLAKNILLLPPTEIIIAFISASLHAGGSSPALCCCQRLAAGVEIAAGAVQNHGLQHFRFPRSSWGDRETSFFPLIFMNSSQTLAHLAGGCSRLGHRQWDLWPTFIFSLRCRKKRKNGAGAGLPAAFSCV